MGSSALGGPACCCVASLSNLPSSPARSPGTGYKEPSKGNGSVYLELDRRLDGMVSGSVALELCESRHTDKPTNYSELRGSGNS